VGATVYVVAALAIVCGAAAQGSLGFGLGLIAAPVLALADERFVPGPLLFVGVVLTVMVALRERGSLDVRGVRWAVAGRIPGTILGAIAIAHLPERGLIVLFAVLVIAAVVVSAAGVVVSPTAPTVFSAGAASGFMGTITSIGGPPMALVYQREKGAQLRSTLAVFFLVGASFSLLVLIVIGRFEAADLRLGLSLVPPMVVGFAVSGATRHWFDRGYIRPAILWFAGVTSVVVLVREVVAAL
jgi:uncharacterized protein